MKNMSPNNEHVINMAMDAHPTDLAIVVKYEVYCADGSNKICQKVIQLKELNESADSSAIAQIVLETCPIIPAHQIVELEQIIFYLQKRISISSSNVSAVKNGQAIVQPARRIAEMTNIESYIEMLYEDTEKLKAVTLILELAHDLNNLGGLVDNEVLMEALTRLFREDSRKNFELATEIATIFYRLSVYSHFHAVLSRYKIGGVTMQLVDHELRRWELWRTQFRDETQSEKDQRKWEFAMRKQDELILVCLKLLLNLSDDVRVEFKMVKRGVVSFLLQCLDHTSCPLLLAVSVNFLIKLTLFEENRAAMSALPTIEKCVHLLAAATQHTSDGYSDLIKGLCVFLFNLSFDSGFLKQMVNSGLIAYVTPLIQSDFVALSLLYQLSIAEDAKAMFVFTYCVPLAMQIIFADQNGGSKTLANAESAKVAKALLINIAVEKRNTQLICGGASLDDNGDLFLERLVGAALADGGRDLLLMKLCHNVAAHEGSTRELFVKWLLQLVDCGMRNVVLDGHFTADNGHAFGLECLRIVNQVPSETWVAINERLGILKFMRNCLERAQLAVDGHADDGRGNITDDVVLQAVVLCGTLTLSHVELARQVSALLPQLVALLNKKQEDDEFVLQIVYVFYCLLNCQDSGLASEICVDGSPMVEYLINLANDKNARLRHLCEKTLYVVVKANPSWSKRIAEERFRWHNEAWLEMVSGLTGGGELGSEPISNDISFLDDFDQSLDQMDHLVLDVDDVLHHQESEENENDEQQ